MLHWSFEVEESLINPIIVRYDNSSRIVSYSLSAQLYVMGNFGDPWKRDHLRFRRTMNINGRERFHTSPLFCSRARHEAKQYACL